MSRPTLCIHSGSCNSQWESVYKQVRKGGRQRGSLAEQDWVQQGSQELLDFVPATEAAYHNTLHLLQESVSSFK